MQLVMQLACRLYQLSPEEALLAATRRRRQGGRAGQTAARWRRASWPTSRSGTCRPSKISSTAWEIMRFPWSSSEEKWFIHRSVPMIELTGQGLTIEQLAAVARGRRTGGGAGRRSAPTDAAQPRVGGTLHQRRRQSHLWGQHGFWLAGQPADQRYGRPQAVAQPDRAVLLRCGAERSRKRWCAA